MKKILIGIILLIALLPIFVSATNWYARQYTPGGYGTSDGASYATAFNGISYIGTGAINWNLIRPGDTLYICGFHDGGNYDYAIYLPRPVLYINGKSGTQASPITIRGDCPGDAATIFGAGMQINSGWTLHDATNNIYKQAYSPLPSNYATITQQAFERYKTADKVNGIVRLNRPGNMNFAYWSPSSYYLDTDNTLYYKPASGSAADYTFYAVYEAPNINFQWAEYFIVKNINLMACANPSFGCNIGIREGANHITIDGVSTRWVSGAGAAIGIGPNNTYITIKNSHIRDAMNGIYFTNNVQHIVVSDNEIYNLDQEGYYYKTLTNRGDHHGIALQGGGDDMIIERNNIHNIGGEGIVWYYDPALTSQMTNVVIRYNLIHDVADLANRSIWPATSQRGIEFGGDHLSNVSIHDNYIYGNIIYNIGNQEDDPPSLSICGSDLISDSCFPH